MKIYLTSFVKIKFARILFLFLLSITFHCSQATADERFDKYKDEREAALLLIKEGNTKLGLISLIKLSDSGDGVSSHSLGLLYLKAHHIVKPNIEKAIRLFEVGALQCFEPSLDVLKQNFWGKINSKYFDAKKISHAQDKCVQKIASEEAYRKAGEQKAAEAESKRLKAEEQKAAEAESRRLKAGEQKAAEAESKRLKAEKENKTEIITGDNNKNLITSDVVMAWSQILPKFSNSLGHGSGFAITKDGYFITNHHVVVREKCKNIAVKYNELNGVGKIIAFSEELDLALLKVNAPTPYFSAFDTTALKAGEPLVALGYPVGAIFGEEPTISEGSLTNASDKETEFRVDGFLIISVPITQGNSGGPIFSNNLGIRGISSYGFRTEDAEDYFQENFGSSLNLSSINLNFMISGIRAYEWLEKSAKFLDLLPIKTSLKKANTQTVAKTGLRVLAKVECYEG